MDGPNGDASVTENADASSTTDVDGKWVWEDWLSTEQLSKWQDWTFYREMSSGTAIWMAVLILALGAGGLFWYQYVQAESPQQQLQKAAQKFNEPLYWPSNRVLTLDAEFHLATKWAPNRDNDGTLRSEDGTLKYKLRIEGSSDALQNAWSAEVSSDYFITILLLDEDDFRITTIKIPLDRMIRTLNPKGETIGFSVQGSKTMPLRTYRRIDDWKVSWNL